MSDENAGTAQLLRAMAEASPLAIAVCEGADHVLRYVNPAFCKLYGRSAGELLGQPFARACPEESAATRTLLDRVFRTGAAESLADLCHRRREGGPDYWSYAAWPLLGAGGVATQVTDTTATRQAAEERDSALRGANQQLLIAALREDERSEKLLMADRAKDEFVAMLAHELRNPLAAIRTGIYLLEQRAAPEDAETHETCALLERQMRHLSRLLDDLLDVSRISRGKIHLRMEPVDLVQVLRHAAAASQCLLELNRHTLSLAMPAGPVWVEGDPVRLEQVATNLLQNAIKYMNPGGQVWLSLAAVQQDPGSPGAGEVAEVRVRDSGIGMSPAALLHIFDLFVQGDPTLDRPREGLGIGLSLVRSLVQLHHGTVQAYSEGPGCGSEFRVLLPLRASAPADAAALQPRATPFERKRILLVEDNVAAAVTLAEVLELWGHEVTTVHTGEAALTAAANCPEVVLLDIGLPDMDGYEVARRLRSQSRLQEALLVALTGYGQAADRQLAEGAGFDHHLVKPVDLEELRRIISTRRLAAAAPERPGQSGATT